jgi:2-oxo-4-hydroxy-4-carboxy--5-ureidoimidazoline (OHCU) decarboxylase
VHDLPRQLSTDELVDLFEGPTRFVQVLAEEENPLGRARAVLDELAEDDRVEALNAHPRLGQSGLTGRSAREQGREDDPALLAVLARLNKAYEQKFGFRFVVFVNNRPRAEILPVLRERMQRAREEELGTGCDELVAIALDRWRTR